VFLSLNDSCLSVFSQKSSGYILSMFFGDDKITLDSAEKQSDNTEDIFCQNAISMLLSECCSYALI